MKMAEMKLKIMEDGKIKIVTDGPIPEELHADADELINFLHKKAGGARETERLHEGHVLEHEHHHNHDHIHHHH
jgi:hypothetical protein